jgi:cation diffusion facilitator family transporter
LDRSLRVTFLGMGINAVLTACKFTAGFLGHSHALIADAAESLADILSSIIAWRALVVAAEPADHDHPYGHGKAEPIASAVIALFLWFGAIEIAVRSGDELFKPRHQPQAFTLYVLIGVVVVKEMLYRYASRQAALAGNMVVATDAWHHRSDAITSLAAAVGIAVCLAFGPRYAFADDAAAILAAVIIAWNAWRLLQPALNELMDAAPSAAVISQIRSVAANAPGVDAVEKCRVRKAGDQYLVDMHIEVDPQMTVQRGHQIAHEVKDRVQEAVPSVRDVLVHVEPSKKAG